MLKPTTRDIKKRGEKQLYMCLTGLSWSKTLDKKKKEAAFDVS